MPPGEIFVFPSNLSARHGDGAAKDAMKFGASYNVAFGFSGNTYAIPTKGYSDNGKFNAKSLHLMKIKEYVDKFIADVKDNPQFIYNIVEIGCGRAGYQPYEIAPLFRECIDIQYTKMPESFWKILVP